MSTEIFKVGDPVFDIRYGFGEILGINNETIAVDFTSHFVDYTKDDDKNFLSFTEYDLVNGGWSQDRSVLNQPKKGDLVYVRDTQEEYWKISFFSHKRGDQFVTYTDDAEFTRTWDFMEFENPLLKEKE